jgi:dTDP-4-dehydrorhamnose reductase
MKAVVTGASGAVGSALVALLKEKGHEVVAWDRKIVPIEFYHRMEDFLRAENPDVLYHLAIASKPTGRAGEHLLVNYEWPSELAWISRVLGFRFVFASTVMVFSEKTTPGPYTLATPADAPEGYGLEKRRAEDRVLRQNPRAVVARLGWQIGQEPGSNNMIDFFEKRMAEEGRIAASRRWFPACSFLEDCAGALLKLATTPPGLYMIESNRGWNFYEIASALNVQHSGRWKIEPNDDFVCDQRMLDPRLETPALSGRLKSLRALPES